MPALRPGCNGEGLAWPPAARSVTHHHRRHRFGPVVRSTAAREVKSTREEGNSERMALANNDERRGLDTEEKFYRDCWIRFLLQFFFFS
jgi:hypothetical protein